jgi:hypothetical protein
MSLVHKSNPFCERGAIVKLKYSTCGRLKNCCFDTPVQWFTVTDRCSNLSLPTKKEMAGWKCVSDPVQEKVCQGK